MIVPSSVENRWGLIKNEKLILVPIKTSRILEIIKDLFIAAVCVLTLGLPFYFNPSLKDSLYYSFFYHRKLIKLHQDPLGLLPLMNALRFKEALNRLGWQETVPHLINLVAKSRIKKIDLEARIIKMLSLFFMAIRQPHVPKTLPLGFKECAAIQSSFGKIGPFNYSAALSAGIKSVMEDVVLVETLEMTVKGTQESISCFILMDGHGIQKGQEPINLYAKKFFLSHLRTYLNAYLKEGFSFCGVYEAFKSSFTEINENFPYQRSGTTFLGLFFINHLMFCVSIGDSKAFLIDPFLRVPLALTADPQHPYFAKKLVKVKASVNTVNSVTRVANVLNMATALGDKHITNKEGAKVIKPSMSFICIPQIWIQSPAYVVLGSDGVFDFLSDKEIEHIIRKESTITDKARDFLTCAFSHGSNDNLSSIVLKI